MKLSVKELAALLTIVIGYIKIYQGNNRWLKTEEEPSDLAKKIIQAIENQNDNNPVLLFFDI
jgi:hypothetical protein